MILRRISGQNVHVRELLQGTFSAFLNRSLGMVTGFLLTIVLARILGPRDFGIFTLASTCAVVAMTVGRFGLDNALLKFASAAVAKQNWNETAAVFKLSILIVFASSAAATACLAILAPVLATRLFAEPQLTDPIRIMALTVVPGALLFLYGEFFRAFKMSGRASLVQSILPPTASFVILGIATVLIGSDITPSGIAWISAAAAGGNILLALVLKWHFIPHARGRQGHFKVAKLLRTSFPLLWVAIMSLVFGATDTIMLGIWTAPDQVAQYGAASKLATLVSFPLVAVNTIAAPKLAGLYAGNDLPAVNTVARMAVVIAIVLSLPVALFYWAKPELALMLFGTGFLPAAGALMLLTAGQFINAATGPVGNLLMLTGHEKLMRNNISGAAVLNIILNVLLIPNFGISGAAGATAISLAIMNLVSLLLANRFVGVSPFPISRRKRESTSP